ncbi:chorismate mutase [Parendozoicomonas haliclonae]|uniref:chorismate mutase n=1 Tax=Parendozoicomonas haliclonae TaxID=1960125 RepID=A0A1X7AJB0_9GAMM|nr:chorismate mutase [Parendozoicomonas haliclonae]SMA45254.1 chorismate mutase [Parendozoicomonas haliclonae]
MDSPTLPHIDSARVQLVAQSDRKAPADPDLYPQTGSGPATNHQRIQLRDVEDISLSDNAREKIQTLFRISNERLSLMPQMAAAKKVLGDKVHDPEREKMVLDGAAAKAKALGLDEALVRRFIQGQMDAAKTLQSMTPDDPNEQMSKEQARSQKEELRKRITELTAELLDALKDIEENLYAPPFKAAVATLITQQGSKDPLHYGQLQTIFLNALYPPQ